MAYSASRSRVFARPRLLIMLLAFFALAIQLLAVESHLHSAPVVGAESASQSTLLGATSVAGSTSTPAHRYPPNDDPSKCPLCQQLGHSSQFISSPVVLVSLCLFVVFSLVASDASSPVIVAIRHRWQSRAPPRG